MTNKPDDFLLKEYEMLWNFTAQLHKERREAARFLLAALPGIPAAILAVLAVLPGGHCVHLSPPAVAPWMLPLLVLLALAGWCYLQVAVRSRTRAVEYTRLLNLTRRALVACRLGRFPRDLQRVHAHWLDPNWPKYAATDGTDHAYAVLLALPVSAVSAAAVFFAAALVPGPYLLWAVPLGIAAFLAAWRGFVGQYTSTLQQEEGKRDEKADTSASTRP